MELLISNNDRETRDSLKESIKLAKNNQHWDLRSKKERQRNQRTRNGCLEDWTQNEGEWVLVQYVWVNFQW